MKILEERNKVKGTIRVLIPTIVQLLLAVLFSSTGTTIMVVVIMSPINISGVFLFWAALMTSGISIAIFYNYTKERIRLEAEKLEELKKGRGGLTKPF